jgi:hypothetical protein
VPSHLVSSLGFSVFLARVPFGLDPPDSFDAVDDLVIRNFIGTVRGVGSVSRSNVRSCRFRLDADGCKFGCSGVRSDWNGHTRCRDWQVRGVGSVSSAIVLSCCICPRVNTNFFVGFC